MIALSLAEIAEAVGGELRLAGSDSAETVVDGHGGVVLPGFVDGHLHMAQWALARRRLDVGAATSARHLVDLLVRSGLTGDVRAQGFRGALWPDAPHKDMLEAALPGVSVAVTSMDLHTVWLSPALLRELGIDHPTGVFRDHDAIAIAGAVLGAIAVSRRPKRS